MSVLIQLNGKAATVDAGTVAELVAGLGFDPQAPGVAVAVGDSVVPRSRWSEHRLSDGDRVEVVRPVQGG